MAASSNTSKPVTTVRRSFCRICHAACPVDVDIVDGRPVRVRGVGEDPIFKGYTCVKGRQLPDQINDPARLRAALKRTDGGTLEEVASGDALDEVAARLQAIIEEHGGRAVASYTGTGGYQNAPSHPVAQAFHRAIDSISYYTSVTIDQPMKATANMRLGIWEAGPQNFTEADVLLAIDIFAPNVSRFVHTIGMDSPERPQPRSEQELLAHLTRNVRHGEDTVALPEGMRARDVYAGFVKEQLGKAYGYDFSELSESITLDSIEYFLFPNAFFFPGLSLPMVYRFRPDPSSVDHCYFDLLMMRPRPPDGSAPPPPEVIHLDVDDSYTAARGLGGLGRVYDQDTANMAAQTRGFKASRKRGQTLGNYQESRVRHLQLRVQDYLS